MSPRFLLKMLTRLLTITGIALLALGDARLLQAECYVRITLSERAGSGERSPLSLESADPLVGDHGHELARPFTLLGGADYELTLYGRGNRIGSYAVISGLKPPNDAPDAEAPRSAIHQIVGRSLGDGGDIVRVTARVVATRAVHDLDFRPGSLRCSPMDDGVRPRSYPRPRHGRRNFARHRREMLKEALGPLFGFAYGRKAP